MIKRLIRWLARKEIDQAQTRGRVFSDVAHAREDALERELVYMRGVNAALEQVEAAVRVRMGGADDAVKLEDVAAAKRGMLH